MDKVRRRAEMDELVHPSVKEDITKIFMGKTRDELLKLKADLQTKLQQENNPGFWQYVLDQLNLKLLRDVKKPEVAECETDPMTSEEANFMKNARERMEKDEEEFTNEVNLGKQILPWSDKYLPRKPRYFNRVRSGFDWNRYNQTHYDMDNPPPKIIEGYRFDIFYPDLVDVTQTPRYTLTECEEDSTFAILKFHAGPPYEDIAFKIINREWEINNREGFRNQFQDGIFQLWFFFKKYRYRR